LALLDPIPDLPVVVLNGDVVTQCDMGTMLEFHERGRYAATIGLKPYSLEIPFGVAEIDGDRLTRLDEKPTEQRLVNAGMYVLSPHAVGMIPKGVAFPMTDLFASCLANEERVGAYVVEDEWIDVGRSDDLRRARGEE
jgi:NDP-sugar pyrophosphorylase family protein